MIYNTLLKTTNVEEYKLDRDVTEFWTLIGTRWLTGKFYVYKSQLPVKQ